MSETPQDSTVPPNEPSSNPPLPKPRRRFRFWFKHTTQVLSLVGVGAIIQWAIWGYQKIQERAEVNRWIQQAEDFAGKDNFADAIKLLDNAIKEYPRRKDLQIRKGEFEIFQDAFQYDQTKKCFYEIDFGEKLNDLIASLQIPLPSEDSAQALFLQGVIAELDDKPEEAVKKFDEAIKKNPFYANAYNYWGATIFKWRTGGEGWQERALGKFKLAAEKDQGYAWPYINQAAVFLSQVKDALAAEPPNTDRAIRYLNDADGSLRMAEERLKDNPRLYLLRGQYHLLEYLRRARSEEDGSVSLKAAEDSLNAAVRYKKIKLPEAYVGLGGAYYYQSRYDERKYNTALARLDEAIKLDEYLIEAYLLKARILRARGDVNEAGRHAQKCLELIDKLTINFTDRKNRSSGSKDAQNWFQNEIRRYDHMKQELQPLMASGTTRQSNAGKRK